MPAQTLTMYAFPSLSPLFPLKYNIRPLIPLQGDAVPINVWAQTGSYVLLALSEIFASITSLEYAFTKAPKNMRSLVMAFSLFQTALASAIGEAFNPLSADPLLTANYGLSMGLAILGGTLFWLQFRGQDRDEDKLNMLPTVSVEEVVSGVMGRAWLMQNLGTCRHGPPGRGD